MAPKAPPKKTRTVSDAHKTAMAEGRTAGRAVNEYLHHLESSAPKRGRKVSVEDMRKRRDEAQARLDDRNGTARLLDLQLIADLDERIFEAERETTGPDVGPLEEAFVKYAGAYGSAKGIGYTTWRAAGVPAEMLKRAGISRTR